MRFGLTPELWRTIRALQPSPRVARLLRRFHARSSELGRRIYSEDADVGRKDEAVLAAYRETAGAPAIVRRARVLSEFARTARVAPAPDDLLLGFQTFNRGFLSRAAADEAAALGYAGTTGHIVHDYERLLRRGVGGLLRDVADAGHRQGAADASPVYAAFGEALSAFRLFIRRHADAAAETGGPESARRAADVHALADAPPRSFPQALQLLWFAQVFLHAENISVAISFGRVDQYLWPFLRDDLMAGRLDLPSAFDWIGAWLIKCGEGEESQNAVLGGVTADGADAANPLSLLILSAMARLRTTQPSLVVRLHDGASPVLVQAACELVGAATGNPGFMNDAVVIEGLRALDIPLERARDWSVVGCYEATLSGAAYPNTVLGQVHLVRTLNAALARAATQGTGEFDDLVAVWKAEVDAAYRETLRGCQKRWNYFRDYAPSPFGSVLMRGCLERGRALEAGGAEFSMAGINLLGLGTLVDGLHALRESVFVRRETTLASVAAAVRDNFPDESLRCRLGRVPGRYGTDSAGANALAREISAWLARRVLDSRLEAGVRPYPAFFAFSADIYATDMASPDGRRAGDLISYGVAPMASVAPAPTAMMGSASNVAQSLAACGCPLSVTLPQSDVRGPEGTERVRQMVQTYFGLGGSHVHVNAVGAGELRRAQADPAAYADLTVRVSGYSARFVTVDRRWQDALIARAERAM